jgi:tetratricopeptide (TPR) repeat protein
LGVARLGAVLPAGSDATHCVFLASLADLSDTEIDDAVSRLAAIRSAAGLIVSLPGESDADRAVFAIKRLSSIFRSGSPEGKVGISKDPGLPASAFEELAPYVDAVVARRIGLPISLAIVELETAWRIGLPLVGIGLPGHFVVGGPGGLLADPAGGGRRLTPDDCQALIRRAVGDGVLFHAGMLRPTGRREILTRVLRNLRTARLARREWRAALDAIDLLLVLEPTDPEHGRDRGLLLGRMGRYGEAVRALSQYLDERPDAHDVPDVRQVIGIFGGRLN